jgi:mannose-6-phosphate isomerase-like protein (cupin superfamily)
MITIEEFENFIQNDIVYQQRLLYYIDDQGRQNPIDSLGQLHSVYGKTLKMEGAEKLNKQIYGLCSSFGYKGPVTCHIFRSFPGSASFPEHTDPDDVLLLMTSGTKDIIIKDNKITLEEGKQFFINANTPHQIINTDNSLMLSIGFERFLVDKI